MVMKPGIDASPKDLIHQIARVFEDMLMNSVREDHTIRQDVYPSSPKIARDQRRHCSSHATVCGGILGMARGCTKRQPSRIGGQVGAASTGLDRRDWSPEASTRTRPPFHAS